MRSFLDVVTQHKAFHAVVVVPWRNAGVQGHQRRSAQRFHPEHLFGVSMAKLPGDFEELVLLLEATKSSPYPIITSGQNVEVL